MEAELLLVKWIAAAIVWTYWIGIPCVLVVVYCAYIRIRAVLGISVPKAVPQRKDWRFPDGHRPGSNETGVRSE